MVPGVETGAAQVLLDGRVGHLERPSNPDGRQLSGVHEAVHRHLGHLHPRGDLGDGERGDRADVPLLGILRRHSTSRA